jgi:hypothetical protein
MARETFASSKTMNWLGAAFIGLVSGVVGLVSVAALAGFCVRWFRVSTFEGAAGYFVVMLALLGGLLGIVIGVVTGLVFNWGSGAAGFFKALGSACGAVVLLTALALLICRMLADLPPEIDGHELALEVEWRLPVGESKPSVTNGAETRVKLGSVVDHQQRAAHFGELEIDQARQVDGRWIIPGSVHLFTRRGNRSVSFQLNGEMRDGFLIPVPARPGKESLEWSDWFPKPRPGDAPWPETKSSVRFRVRPILPEPPPPDPIVVEAEKIAALDPHAPLADWLAFLKYDAPADRNLAVMRVVAEQPEELARLIGSDKADLREQALFAVTQLREIKPVISEAVRAEGRAIAGRLKEFNRMNSEEPDFYGVQMELRSRFSYWHRAWWTVHQRSGIDGRPAVQEILELAEVRAKETSMSEIVINAKAHLGGIKTPEPLPQ